MNEEISIPQNEEPNVSAPEGASDEANELASLREQLQKAETALAELTDRETRLRGEFEEFVREFPHVPFGEVGADVFEQMQAGVPMAAAYALSRHRQSKAKEQPKGTWQKVDGGTDEGLFSPAEVRAMTPMEVRRHYPRIMESMKHWQK